MGARLIEYNREILLLSRGFIRADESERIYRGEERVEDGGEGVHFD